MLRSCSYLRNDCNMKPIPHSAAQQDKPSTQSKITTAGTPPCTRVQMCQTLSRLPCASLAAYNSTHQHTDQFGLRLSCVLRARLMPLPQPHLNCNQPQLRLTAFAATCFQDRNGLGSGAVLLAHSCFAHADRLPDKCTCNHLHTMSELNMRECHMLGALVTLASSCKHGLPKRLAHARFECTMLHRLLSLLLDFMRLLNYFAV